MTLCALSTMTGRLPIFESYQKDGNGAQTTSKVLQCDLSPDISWLLVTQLSVKLFMNSLHMIYYQPINLSYDAMRLQLEMLNRWPKTKKVTLIQK